VLFRVVVPSWSAFLDLGRAYRSLLRGTTVRGFHSSHRGQVLVDAGFERLTGLAAIDEVP
jgi:hypothetical protein